MVDREMRRGGEGTRADEERGGATLPGSGRCAGRCARPGVNAHRLPIRRRPQGSSRPRMSKSDTKGFQCTGRMNENLGIMRLCFARMRAAQAFVSDLDIHGSFRAPALAAGGARWGHYRQPEPWATRSVRRAGGFDCGPGPMATPPRRSIRCACWHAPGLEPQPRGGSCPVSPRSRQSSGSSCATAARRARASSSQVWQRWARASPRSHRARESSRGTEPASRRCTTATSSSRARS